MKPSSTKGVFSANQLKFDKDYLKELTGLPDSGVFEQHCKYHICLHPAQLIDYDQAIKDELSKKIGRYDEPSFDGILLGFQNVKLHSDIGLIGSDSYYIHMDVSADFFIFRPKLDMVLNGTVTRITKDHVGCLTYQTFNVSLPKTESDDDSWLGSRVNVGSEVQFQITYVNLFARLPHIRGEIESIIGESGAAITQTKLKKKNKKTVFHNEDNSAEQTDVVVNEPTKIMQASKYRKPKKSQPPIQANEESKSLTEETQAPKKKHRKNKQEDHLNDSAETSQIGQTEERPQKEKRKHKQKTLEDSQLSVSADSVTEASPKKRKHKRKDSDRDVSLESLDMKSLFADADNDFSTKVQESGVSETKSKRKRSQSMSQEFYLPEIKLEPDSDLEKIVGKSF